MTNEYIPPTDERDPVLITPDILMRGKLKMKPVLLPLREPQIDYNPPPEPIPFRLIAIFVLMAIAWFSFGYAMGERVVCK